MTKLPKPCRATTRGLRIVLAILVPLFSQVAWAGENLETGWAKIRAFEFNEALDIFENADPEIDPRERVLGEAVSLLNAQPRSDTKARKALALFATLCDGDQRDTIATLSFYYMGRVHEMHLDQPEREKAIELYRKVLAMRSGNPLAEMAASSIIFLELYDVNDRNNVREKLEAQEILAADLLSDLGRCEYHRTLGFAYLELPDESDPALLAKAVGHLKAADAFRLSKWEAQASLWSAIGEASRVMGDKQTAIEYYTRLVETHKRDRRHQLISERLEELKGEPNSKGGNP